MGKKGVIIFVLTSIFILSGCDSKERTIKNESPKKSNFKELKSSSVSKSNKWFDLKEDQIQSIQVRQMPRFTPDTEIKNKEQISEFVSYFNGLHPKDTDLNPGEFNGGFYSISFQLTDGSARELILGGNKFFWEIDSFKTEIPYHEAIIFDKVLSKVIYNNALLIGVKSIKGKVISVKIDENGRNVEFELQKDKLIYHVYVMGGNIIDSTGNGWLILHKGDNVNVLYKETDLKDLTIKSEFIFIQ